MSEREGRVLTTLDPVEYHAMERLSSSGCKQILRSPKHFRTWKDEPKIATPQMLFGTVVHTLLLEPEHAATRIVIMPADAPTRQSNAGREWHADFQTRAAGKVVISTDDYARACAARTAMQHSRGWTLLRADGHVETSLLWKYGRALCKARPDYFAADFGVVVDVKTAADASREAFMRAMWNMRYDIQGAFYMEGIYAATTVLPHSFVWGVVESDPPHGVAWYRMGHADFEIARADIANAVDVYAECVTRNEWPSYPDDVQEIRLPPWARSARRNDNQQEF